jgi:hypothetical protein
MTRFGESRFSVGSNSKSAARNYADNYDRIFRKDPLKSLSQEEYDALPELTEERIQAALDEARPGAQELDRKLKRVMR